MLKRLHVRSRKIQVNEDCVRLAGSNAEMAEAVRHAAGLAAAAMGLFAGEYRYSVPSFPALRFDLPWRQRYIDKFGAVKCEAEFTQMLVGVYGYALDMQTHLDGCLEGIVIPSSEEEWIQTLAVEAICYIDSFLVCAEHGDEYGAWAWWTDGNRIFNELTWKASDLVRRRVPDEYGNLNDVATLHRLADT